MTQSTLSKYFERARRVYRPANVKLRVSPDLRAKDKGAMKYSKTDEVEFVAAVAEALILIIDERFFDEWVGTNELTADFITSLAEILHNRSIDRYELYEYLAAYDTLDDVMGYDINDSSDKFDVIF